MHAEARGFLAPKLYRQWLRVGAWGWAEHGAGLAPRPALSPMSPQSGGSDQERTKKQRRGDRYSVQTSLIVATLKKMLPIGLNMCAPTDQELIMLAKTRYALVPAQPY